jgi:hypothetical protein
MLSRRLPVPPPPSAHAAPEISRRSVGRQGLHTLTRLRAPIAVSMFLASAVALTWATWASPGYTFETRLADTSGRLLLACAAPTALGVALLGTGLLPRGSRPGKR